MGEKAIESGVDMELFETVCFERDVAERDLRRIMSAAKQWKNATESRLRLSDSRGEAAKSMLKPDADFIAVINELSEEVSGE